MLRLINGHRKKRKKRHNGILLSKSENKWAIRMTSEKNFSFFRSCCRFINVDLIGGWNDTLHKSSQIMFNEKSHNFPREFTRNRHFSGVHSVQPPPILYIRLFTFVCVLRNLTFFGVFLKNMRHLYMFFQFLFAHSSQCLFCWYISNCCCWCAFLFGACTRMNIIQNAKMRKDKYSWNSNFSYKYYVYTNVYTTRR